MRLLLATFILVFATYLCRAQATIQNFSSRDVITNSTVSLNDCRECSGVVLIFSSNECAFDQYYRDRVNAIAAAFQGNIQFLLVNSHTEPEETAEKMIASYPSFNTAIPYLADKDQSIMNLLGARKSPEVFLLKNTEGNYSILYSGAIDDNPQLASAAKSTYLETAIENMLAGKKTPTSTRAVGCAIRKK